MHVLLQDYSIKTRRDPKWMQMDRRRLFHQHFQPRKFQNIVECSLGTRYWPDPIRAYTTVKLAISLTGIVRASAASIHRG
jgi:hypothetical protein